MGHLHDWGRYIGNLHQRLQVAQYRRIHAHHLLIPVTFFSLWRALSFLAQGNHRGHQLTMQWTYALACVVTGLFTLLPQRYLGQLLWGS